METAEKLITENLDVWTSAVKAKSSAGRGSSNKRELYGVGKLRELILELAVRGLLTPSDVKWSEAKFGETFDIQGGTQPPKSQFIFEPQEGYVRLLQIRDLGEKPVPTFIPKDSARRFCDENDILIGRYGASVGKVFRGHEGAYNVALAKLIWSPDTFSQDFLITWLKSGAFQDRLAGASRSAQAGFNKGDLASIRIQYPPLAEQHRIVAKVDELMALCDQLEQEQESSLDTHDTLVATLLGALTEATASAEAFAQAWQRIQANFDTLFTTESSIDQLKQTILQLAVMGKLVEQDPEDEPARVCFDRIEKDKKNSHLKATKIDKEAIPESIHIPGTWLRLQLGEVASIRTGFAFKSKDYQDSGTFILRVTNINPDGSFDRSNSVFLPDSLLDKKMEGFLLTEGELLVVMVGGSLGKIGRVTESILPALLNQNMWRILSFSENYNADFLHLVLRDLNENRLKITSSTHGHLAMGVYAASFIPLPPLAEQHRIVAKVDELMALCDQLKASLATAQATQLNLADSLVEQAVT